MKDGCPFCDYDGPSEVLARGEFERKDEAGFWIVGSPWFVIEPLNPVTPGHLLVVPERHIEDFRSDPYVLGELMEVAASASERWHHGEACNLIVSAGEAATQTVGHVHVHVVPRREGDGLKLPWSGQPRRTEFAEMAMVAVCGHVVPEGAEYVMDDGYGFCSPECADQGRTGWARLDEAQVYGGDERNRLRPL